MKSKIIKALIICLIIAGVSTGGYFGYQKFFASKTAATAPSYITMRASRMKLDVNIQSTGAAYTSNIKDITAGASGTLTSLNVKVGDTVKEGDKLFTVDSDQLKQSVTKVQANLDKLKLQLAQVKRDAAAAASTTTATTTGNNQGSNQNSNSRENYDNQIASLDLDIAAAQRDLTAAKDALSRATVKAPISGVVTACTASSGDNVQTNTAVLTIMDTSSIKIKVAVDELDIEKVKIGQTAQIKFGAIKDKTYEGTVEGVALTGTSSNNVTTYDVIVGISDSANIKIGMNANVNILVESKDNALVIPAEALVENNGKKYVRVETAANAQAGQNNQFQNTQGNQNRNQQAQSNEGGQAGSGQNSTNTAGNRQSQRANRQGMQGAWAGYSTGEGRLVEIKTGIENENYIEVLEGVTEGERLLVALPQSTTSTNANNRNNFSGFGNFGGGARQQAPVSTGQRNNNSNRSN